MLRKKKKEEEKEPSTPPAPKKEEEWQNYFQAERAYEQIKYLQDFLELAKDTRHGLTPLGRSAMNGRHLMILQTFESIYGRTLYERIDDNWIEMNEWGLWKVANILSEAAFTFYQPKKKKVNKVFPD